MYPAEGGIHEQTPPSTLTQWEGDMLSFPRRFRYLNICVKYAGVTQQRWSVCVLLDRGPAQNCDTQEELNFNSRTPNYYRIISMVWAVVIMSCLCLLGLSSNKESTWFCPQMWAVCVSVLLSVSVLHVAYKCLCILTLCVYVSFGAWCQV